MTCWPRPRRRRAKGMTPYVHPGCNPELSDDQQSWDEGARGSRKAEWARQRRWLERKVHAHARRSQRHSRARAGRGGARPAQSRTASRQHLSQDADAGGRRTDPARRYLPHRLRRGRLSHGVGRLRRKRRGQVGAPRRLRRIRQRVHRTRQRHLGRRGTGTRSDRDRDSHRRSRLLSGQRRRSRWPRHGAPRRCSGAIAPPSRFRSRTKARSYSATLNIYSAEPNAFTAEEIRLLEELAGDLAFGIVVLRVRAERKHIYRQLQANLHFFECMDQVNLAMQETCDLEPMMSQVLGATLSIFKCDRAWLVYPCDPEAASWRVPMERTRPEYPGALAQGIDFPLDLEVRETMAAVLASRDPVSFGPGSERASPEGVSTEFGIQSMLCNGHPPEDGQGLHVRAASMLFPADLDRGRETAVPGDRPAPRRWSDQPERAPRPARPRGTVAHAGADHSRSGLDEGRQRRFPALQSAVRALRRRQRKRNRRQDDLRLRRQGSRRNRQR